MTCYAQMSLIMPDFIALGQTMYDKSLTKLVENYKKLGKFVLPEKWTEVYQIRGTSVHWKYP